MRIQFNEHIQGRSTGGLDMNDSSDCRLRLRAGSRSFYAASLLLPPSVRGHATALYAFCRVADDAVDCAQEVGAVAALERRLSRIYAGCPDDIPADRAFAETAARFAIPKAVPEALLEGFAWDAANRRYEDLSDVIAYAARVAGSVGIMMAMVMGVTSQAGLARACDLGVAMQLSNIARDVGEDARAGRLYLPRQWFREAGMDPDRWLADPVFDPAIAHMVARLLTTAEVLYSRADLGIRALPPACRPGIRAARLIYAEIGAEVTRGGYDSISRRAVVSSSRKIGLVLKAMLTVFTSARWEELAPLPETRFLVEAVPAYGAPHQRTHKFGWWNLDARIDRFFELLMRLENAEHAARGRS